jgi:hypothetical protein
LLCAVMLIEILEKEEKYMKKKKKEIEMGKCWT